MIAVASLTPKTEEKYNQDYAVQSVLANGCRLMAVADGLGSFEYAEEAARYAVEAVLEFSNQLTGHNFIELFTYIQQSVRQRAIHFLQTKSLQVDLEKSFGTTLIVVLETTDAYYCAYCGNGGLFYIRGNFDQFQPTQYLPWNAINLLNPHTIQNEQGKEALYKLISPNSSVEEYTPTVLQLSKDKILYGEMIMICTDGIFSNDQLPIGKDAKGNLWISGEQNIAQFYEHLKPLPKHLEAKLIEYLQQLKSNKALDDDATLGVMISETMLEYHKKR